MVGARACLHPDEARRQLFKEGKKTLPPNAPLQSDAPVGVDAVDLENLLGEIETYGSDRHSVPP